MRVVRRQFDNLRFNDLLGKSESFGRSFRGRQISTNIGSAGYLVHNCFDARIGSETISLDKNQPLDNIKHVKVCSSDVASHSMSVVSISRNERIQQRQVFVQISFAVNFDGGVIYRSAIEDLAVSDPLQFCQNLCIFLHHVVRESSQHINERNFIRCFALISVEIAT